MENEILRKIKELEKELQVECKKLEVQGKVVVIGYNPYHGDELFIADIDKKTKSIRVKVD
jgi:hypothetical protein